MECADDARDNEDHERQGQATEVECPAAEMAHAEPRADACAYCAAVHADGEVEAICGVEAGLFVEICGVAGHGAAAQGLCCPDHAADLCSAEVGALEAIEVRHAAAVEVLLDFVGVLHHRDGFVGIEVRVGLPRSEAKERSLCFGDFLVADEPPWAFWGEEDAYEDWDCECPL